MDVLIPDGKPSVIEGSQLQAAIQSERCDKIQFCFS